MSWFPQVGAGSIAQYPLERVRRWRAISNRLENGERITLPDYGTAEILWDLSYEDLNNAEAGQIRGLFDSVFGEAGIFTFIDPLVNLLGWSEDPGLPKYTVEQTADLSRFRVVQIGRAHV